MSPLRLDPVALGRATRHLASADPVFARLVADLGPCRLEVRRGLSRDAGRQ